VRPLLSQFIVEMSGDGHSPGTIKEYRYTIQRWERSGLPAIDYLATIEVAPGTRALRAHILKRYLAWEAQRIGHQSELADVRFRTPPPTPERPFSHAEVDALLAASKPLERAVIVCLLGLGVRASELAGIRTEDIDGETVIIHGKGGKSRVLAATGLVGPLRAIVEAGLDYQGIYRTMRRVGRRAGVANCHPHRCRHSFANNFLSAGGDFGNLRLLLGHSSWEMTARYCRFFEAERAIAAHRRFLQK